MSNQEINQSSQEEKSLTSKVKIIYEFIAMYIKEFAYNFKQIKKHYKNIHFYKYQKGIEYYTNGDLVDARNFLLKAVKDPKKQYMLAYYYLGNIELTGYITYFQYIKIKLFAKFKIYYNIVPNVELAKEYYNLAIKHLKECPEAQFMLDKIDNKVVDNIPLSIIKEKYNALGGFSNQDYLIMSTNELIINTVKKYLDFNNKILDLGCGIGMLGKAFNENNINQHLIGVDISNVSIKKAKKIINNKGERIYNEIHENDIISYLQKNNGIKFDSIIASGVSQYFANLEELLLLLYGKLNKNGILILDIHRSFNRNQFYNFNQDLECFTHSKKRVLSLLERVGFIELEYKDLYLYNQVSGVYLVFYKK